MQVEELARMIDHSILLLNHTERDLEEGVDLARNYRVNAVVPKPYQAVRTKELLRGSDVKLCIAIAFPQGLSLPEVKQYEAKTALEQGAQELDMVINTTALKSGQYGLVERDIAGVVEVARPYDAPVKVIIETCLLTDSEKVAACQIAERAGAAFVKTSTATQNGGATVEDVRLMRKTLSPSILVKASGFITDVDKALALYEAGARRFGTGYTGSILEGLRRRVTVG